MSDTAAFFAKKNNNKKFNGLNANRIGVSQVSSSVMWVFVLQSWYCTLQLCVYSIYAAIARAHDMDMEEFTIAFLSIPWLRLFDLYRALASQVFQCQKLFRTNLYFHSLSLIILVTARAGLRVSKWKLQQRQSPHINVTCVKQVLSSGKQWSRTLHQHIILHPKILWRRINDTFLLVHIKQNLSSGKQLITRTRTGSKVTHKDANKDTFPLNIGEAYEKVLKSDTDSLRQRDVYHRHDSLNVGGFGEPFSRWYAKRSILPRVRYRKKPQYKRFSNSELDSLQRYKFHRMTKPKYCFNRWLFNDHKDSKMGTLFESWFSCHALQHESCFNCKGRNSLRWYRGSNSSRQDLICTACHSTYKVKSKAIM